MSKQHLTRRSAMKKMAASGLAMTFLPSYLALGKEDSAGNKPPSKRLNIAMIGSGGWIAQHAYKGGCGEEKLVAFCDVDTGLCAENMKNWRTDQPFFEDYRVMLDKMHKDIDAVVVSTPNHTHFAATYAAMERGIHVYTQKPLTQTIWEARSLRKAAQRFKVVTQMGNQGHASNGTRVVVETVRSGLIGKIREVIAYSEGPDFNNTMHWVKPDVMPLKAEPVPAGLNWDLWLGPVEHRDYNHAYIPKTWRSFFDFGSGEIGDWGCHMLDQAFWALDLDIPSAVDVIERAPSPEGFMAPYSTLDFHFPARGGRDAIKLRWYDGLSNVKKKPEFNEFGFSDFSGRGSVIVGEKGLIRCGPQGDMPAIFPQEKRAEFKASPPPQTIPRVEGGSFREWIRAAKGEGPTPGSSFEYSARLTEMILLGVVAQRGGKERVEWDIEAGQVSNHPELNALVKIPARKGWDCGEA